MYAIRSYYDHTPGHQVDRNQGKTADQCLADCEWGKSRVDGHGNNHSDIIRRGNPIHAEGDQEDDASGGEIAGKADDPGAGVGPVEVVGDQQQGNDADRTETVAEKFEEMFV